MPMFKWKDGTDVRKVIQAAGSQHFTLLLEDGRKVTCSDYEMEQLTDGGRMKFSNVQNTGHLTVVAGTATFWNPNARWVGGTASHAPVYDDYDDVEYCAYCGSEWHAAKYRRGTCEACGAPRFRAT